MSSYYKKIDGKNYDKAMLDIAAKSVSGKGDGRISLADARSIIKLIKDGGKITDIEGRTLNYILENYKLTETALKHIEKSLSENISIETKKESKSENRTLPHDNISETKKNTAPEKGGKKIFIFLILVLLAIFAVFTYIKYFYRNDKTENIMPEKKDNVSDTLKEDSKAPVAETANVVTDVKQAEASKIKPLAENEYMVKEKDTLIKISEALYGDYRKWENIYRLNKGKISNPVILYPGQILILPEKETKK